MPYTYYEPTPLERKANNLMLEMFSEPSPEREAVLRTTLAALLERVERQKSWKIKQAVELNAARILADECGQSLLATGDYELMEI